MQCSTSALLQENSYLQVTQPFQWRVQVYTEGKRAHLYTFSTVAEMFQNMQIDGQAGKS